jgi:hypothetical protein
LHFKERIEIPFALSALRWKPHLQAVKSGVAAELAALHEQLKADQSLLAEAREQLAQVGPLNSTGQRKALHACEPHVLHQPNQSRATKTPRPIGPPGGGGTTQHTV